MSVSIFVPICVYISYIHSILYINESPKQKETKYYSLIIFSLMAHLNSCETIK